MEDQKEVVEVQTESITFEEFHSLEISKMKRMLALANSEKAAAQLEASDGAVKVVTLQLARKYNLKDGDEIQENGKIVRK